MHWPAWQGHLEVCHLIIENVQMNPADESGVTPLHCAAIRGHLEVCCLIMENVEDKNPADQNGVTPLKNATSFNHTAVIGLFKNIKQQEAPVDSCYACSHQRRGNWTKLINIFKCARNIQNCCTVE